MSFLSPGAHARNTASEPDFAYPQTVLSKAKANLDTYNRRTDAEAGALRLRAILEIMAAERSIDPDTAFTFPAFIGEQLKVKGLGDADRAMLKLLEAETLKEIYRADRYKYDRVAAPLEPLPADVSLWSGEQFKARINALYAEARALAAAQPMALTHYKNALKYNEYGLLYIPDVAAFADNKYCYWLSYTGENDKMVSLAKEISSKFEKGSAQWCYWAVKAANDDKKELCSLYRENASAPEARYILRHINRYDYGEVEIAAEDDGQDGNSKSVALRDELINMLRESLRQFPDWYDNGQLRNTLAALTQARFNASAPQLLGPGSSLKIKASASFCKKVTFRLYKCPSRKDYSLKQINASKSIAERTVTGLGNDSTFTVEFPIAKSGYYAWTASIDGATPTTSGYVDVVPVYPVSVNGLEDQYVAVADMNSGAPAGGVDVILNGSNWRKRGTTAHKLGTTDKNGVLSFTAYPDSIYNSQTLAFRYEGVTYDFNNSIRTYRPGVSEPAKNSIVILTDRNLYHQGDTVRWAVVASDKAVTASGSTVALTFYDANYQTVDATTCTLDGFGRADGSFVTKKNVLTGRWRIRAEIGNARTDTYIEVSDFRLPTFHADVTSVERDMPAAGAVRISGCATTFSGMPVIGAQVKLKLSKAQRWRWFAPMEPIGELNGETDATGAFSFDIPADMLAKGPDFYAEITVTAADGAVADTSRGFTTGKPYSLSAECARNADSSSPLAVKFMAYDANGKDIAIPVKWQLGTLKNNRFTDMLAEGDASTGAATMLALQNVPAGEYTIRVAPVDTTLAQTVNAATITLFNEKKNEVPATAGRLYLPFTSVKADGDKAEILLGISGAAAYVYIAENDGGKLRRIDVKKLEPGFHRIKVNPDSKNPQIKLFCVADARLSAFDVNIERESGKTQIIAESFRDKLTPGAGETWRFRLVGADGKVLDAAMIATLYNRALDNLYTGGWPSQLSKYSGTPYYGMYLSGPRTYSAYVNEQIPFKTFKTATIEFPNFRYLEIGGYRYIRGTMMRSMKTAALAAPEMAEEESVVNDMAYATGATADLADGVQEKESTVTAEDAVAEETAPEKFEYRVAEVLQAFWRPSLTADKEGNIDLTFTMPNANGAWTFKSLAWSKDLESASYIAECVSNKPVMVQPNLPRYLRQGDTARVLATVFNNSDESAVVSTTVEIFDIATGAVITSSTSTDTIATKASAVAGIDVSAPVDAASLGYRVRSQAGRFADGEQSLIPILSSSATVVESTEFYLNPDESKPFELSLKAPSDASVSLQYCQNPVWTAVKAMRGLAGKNSDTATGLASGLFSALAAGKIIADNPAVAAVIKQWQDNPDEGAFKSMLEKNEDLKVLLLDQAPWVQTAANESSRMAMLAQVLDPEKTAAAVAAAITGLSKLQNPDGGFAWTGWSKESSVWSTQNVLITLGIANTLGMLPDDARLTGIMQKAYSYLVTEALKPNRPKTDTSLAYIASALPTLSDSRAKAIIAATESAILSGWKKGNVLDKAWDILVVNKNYRRTADEMLASIRQFAVAKPGMGMTFPSVGDIRSYATIIQAYAVMGASQKEIDALRQWVLVQCQASDDFGTYNPDYIIAALMLTGSVWTDVPVKQNVTVNGHPIELNSVESASGYFAQKIDVKGKFTVSVTPNGVTPSYGSVITINRRPMTTVKARPGRDISITKRVLVQRDGKWVETNNFNLGERVRVQLTIKTNRNLEYVSITDERPAAFEPVDQLPGFVWDGGTGFYRENLDASTRLAIGYLAKGSYHITYDMTAAVAGTFISGIATLQSQYAPELTAHSGGNTIEVK